FFEALHQSYSPVDQLFLIFVVGGTLPDRTKRLLDGIPLCCQAVQGLLAFSACPLVFHEEELPGGDGKLLLQAHHLFPEPSLLARVPGPSSPGFAPARFAEFFERDGIQKRLLNLANDAAA